MNNNGPIDPAYVPEFVAAFFAQAGSFDQEEALQDWLNANPCNRRLLDEYMDIWQGVLKAEEKHDYNEHEAWNRFRNSYIITDQEDRRDRFYLIHPGILRGIAAAALTAFIILLSGYLAVKLYNRLRYPLTYSEYSVPYGSKSHMTLPDGSSVWLNAGSKIVYSSQYGIRNRDLKLEGEAHFTVLKAKQPFMVHTKNLTVAAIGTVFNIKAYPEEKTIETTVEQGVVKITNNIAGKWTAQPVLIMTRQKATYTLAEEYTERTGNDYKTNSKASHDHKSGEPARKEVGKITISNNIMSSIYTSWKDEKWIIEHEELQSLAIKLERRYNIKFIFTDESLKHYIFSGILMDETLEQVLEAIKLTAPIGFKIEHDTVIFYEMNALKSRLKGN
ncbi:MAG: FecR family protein [Bacteroidales bacterium]|nr:FecR family protein [Bacteroidales bacterium]